MSEQSTGEERRPLGDAFAQMGDELSASLRAELEALRAEAAERARDAARAAGLLTASGVSGAIAAGALLSLPVMALRRLLPSGVTALLVAGGAGALSAVLAKRGLDALGVPTDVVADRAKDVARDAVAQAT